MQTQIAPRDACLVGRAWRVDLGPCVIAVREGVAYDITSRATPTMRDLIEREDAAIYAREAPGEAIGAIADLAYFSWENFRDGHRPFLISPIDLQAVKAAGVTFAASLLERVIEEQAHGDPSRAQALRRDLTTLIGADFGDSKPGSAEAMQVKQALIARGAWSQYLEVGIGPDAEIFTKCQPMASVGYGAEVGILEQSHWNNPEPEIALIVAASGAIRGATLGNDVNLRDIEGRSALLLGRAKDNNASAALGPFIRLFDAGFTLDDVRAAEIALRVRGEDGFALIGASSMRAISRDPAALVAAALGAHHQYPDGFCLFLGTMFAPTQDRGAPGAGFTHHLGDIVEISCAALGTLANRVNVSERCAPWRFGAGALMRNLAARGLLG